MNITAVWPRTMPAWWHPPRNRDSVSPWVPRWLLVLRWAGDLVRVLRDWVFENTSIFALYPSGRQLSTKVRATVDFLAENLKDPSSWDRELIGVPGFAALGDPGVNCALRAAEGTDSTPVLHSVPPAQGSDEV